MPRGTCENCGQHDVFVYAVPIACGWNAFICARCMKLPEACLEDDDEEDFDWEQCRSLLRSASIHLGGCLLDLRQHDGASS